MAFQWLMPQSVRHNDEVNVRRIRASAEVQGGYAPIRVSDYGRRQFLFEVAAVNPPRPARPGATPVDPRDHSLIQRTRFTEVHIRGNDELHTQSHKIEKNDAKKTFTPVSLDTRSVCWNIAEERMEKAPVRKVVDKERAKVESKLYNARDWVEPGALSGLLCLMQTRSPSSPPFSLFSESIAPFLRFETPLPNMLYAIGGRNQSHGPLNVVEMLDTWHGRWVRCPPMSSRRSGCAAAPLPDGRVAAVGGYDERGVVKGLLNTCEAFNPVSQQWRDFAPLLRARWGHGCAALRDKVYVVGGCSLRIGAPVAKGSMETLASCEVYDCNLDKWTQCANLVVARASARAVVIGEKYIAAVGGCKNVFGDWDALRTVELLHPDQNLWIELEMQLSVPRAAAATAAVDSHRILVFGGADQTGPALSSSEIYCVEPPFDSDDSIAQEDTSPFSLGLRRRGELRKTRQVVDVQQSRMGCQALALNLPSGEGIHHGRGFPFSNTPHVAIVGGESENHSWQLDSLLCYDVELGTWLPQSQVPVPAMPTKRTALALCNSFGRADLAVSA